MTTSGLLLNVLFSCIGGGYALYGRKQQKAIPLVCGVILMFYGYFTDTTWILMLIGIVFAIVPFIWRE